MTAIIIIGPRRFRSPYRRRGNHAGAVAVVAVAAAGALLASAGAKAPASHAGAKAGAAAAGRASVPVKGGGEAAFVRAALADLGAPASAANVGSLEAWGSREGCWGCVGANNQFDSTLYEPGSTAFNTFGGGLHVWNYPTPAIGAQATAVTIGGYPAITAALRSGSGVCGPGFAAEFSRWSGGGYTEVC